MDTLISVTASESPTEYVIQLAGVVGINDAARFHALTIAAADAGKPVLIDFAEAERLDASTWQILVALDQEVKSQDRSLSLINVPPAIVDYAKTAGLTWLLASEAAA